MIYLLKYLDLSQYIFKRSDSVLGLLDSADFCLVLSTTVTDSECKFLQQNINYKNKAF